MDTAAFPSDLARFVHDLVIIGAWLDEVWVGITAELLPASSQRESLRDVVFGMLCATIEPALEPVDPRDLARATEIINQVAARVEEHLALTGGLAQPMPRSADGRTDG